MSNTLLLPLPKYNRAANGSLYDRGAADAYYSRGFNPHCYIGGVSTGKRVDDLTDEEIQEYRAGYKYAMSEGNFKDWN